MLAISIVHLLHTCQEFPALLALLPLELHFTNSTTLLTQSIHWAIYGMVPCAMAWSCWSHRDRYMITVCWFDSIKTVGSPRFCGYVRTNRMVWLSSWEQIGNYPAAAASSRQRGDDAGPNWKGLITGGVEEMDKQRVGFLYVEESSVRFIDLH